MEPISLRKYKVLVVEDEPLVAMVIEDMLESLGCTVVGPVAQLAEALDLAQHNDCDCAILDVNVRGGSITPVADAFIKKGVPILLASGYSESALPAHLARHARLTKPYTSEQLEDGIRCLFLRVDRDEQSERPDPS